MSSTTIEPRISINSLGEYLFATPVRRSSLIKQQKKPNPISATYYNDAAVGISRYLIDGAKDAELLVEKIEELEASNPEKEWHKIRNKNNILCLQAFYANHEDALDLSRFKLIKSRWRSASLNIKGIKVSVRPELYLMDNQGQNDFGAIKLYIKKGNPLDKEMAMHSALLVNKWVKHNLATDGSAPRDMSIIYDVFANNVFVAPKSSIRRMNNIKASCLEIKQRWNSI